MDDILVINEGAKLESHTSKSGKTRFTVTIQSEPVVFNFDPHLLGAPVAQAIAHHFRERVKQISAVASPATIKAREAAAKAFQRGEAWATKRYGGGRTGPMEPNQSNRLFNDSGRFAETITANAGRKDAVWRVNVAANRLSGDPGTVQRIWKRLVELVPEFGNPALLLGNDVIRASIKRAQGDMVRKAGKTTGKLQVGVAKALFRTVKSLANIADSLAS